MDLFNTIALYCFSIIAGIFVLYDGVLLYLLTKAYRQESTIARLSYQEAKMIPDSKLPVVTILLPLYKEKLTIPYLIESISKIDYPKGKLDVRLLIEEEDEETQEAVKDFAIKNKNIEIINSVGDSTVSNIQSWDQIVINIDYVMGGTRTKPNALNVGLRHARGKILCIYDAEDRPDEKQIRTIVAYMLKHPDVACVQAR
jgi:cellulose synthase/poly-beta-1,6-N-acetylglucosamine synthase-like glycosyltransferase